MEWIFEIKSFYIFKEQKKMNLDYKNNSIKNEVNQNYNQSYTKHLLNFFNSKKEMIFSIDADSLNEIENKFVEKYKNFAGNYLLFNKEVNNENKKILFEDKDTVFEIDNLFKVEFILLDEANMIQITIYDLVEEKEFKFDLDRKDIKRTINFTINEIKKIILRKNGKKYKIK
jgi:hypothetical protein